MPVQIGAPTLSGADLSVSDTLSQWSTQLQREQTAKNLARARQQGLESDVSEGPQKKQAKFGFLGSKTAEQFNQGARDAYLLGVDRDNTQEIARIAQEADGDIDKFNTVMDSYRSSVLGNVDPASLGQVRLTMDRIEGRARVQVQGRGIQRQQRDAEEERRKAFTVYGDEAVRLVRNNDLEGAQENLLKARASVDSMVLSGDISQAEADELFDQQKKGVFAQGFKREVLDIADSDLPKAFQRVDELERAIPQDFVPREWEAVIDDMRSDLTRLQSRRNQSGRSGIKLARDELKKYRESVSMGFDVPPSEKSRVFNMVVGTELEDDFQRIHKVQQFSLLDSDSRRQVMNQAEDRATTLETQQDFMAIQDVNNKLRKFAEKDGYSLGVRQGLIDQVPLDMNNPESIRLRADQAEQLSDHYGIEVSAFTDEEADAIASNLDGMTSGEKMALADTLNQAPAVWKQIAGKNAGTFAMAGATGDNEVMQAVFKGQELVENKVFKLPSTKDYQLSAISFLGNVGEVYGANDYRDVVDAALNHYLATTSNPLIFDDNDFEDSLAAVTGGIQEVNGFKVELPREVDGDDFEDFIDEIQPEIVAELGGLKFWRDDEIQKLQDAQVVSEGDGVYTFIIDGLAQLNDNNEPFTVRYTPEMKLRNDLLVRRKRLERAAPLGRPAIEESIRRVEAELEALNANAEP